MTLPEPHLFDLFIVGGGINGVGIARDAAGRGLNVALCERGDLGGATSSASSKLIHGGLRYLEHGAFRLVREALSEREILLRVAPHLVRPLRFVIPDASDVRPPWMLRAGLFLYDYLSRHTQFPNSARVNLSDSGLGTGLKSLFRRGFTYQDAWVDDARLVIVTAADAASAGAQVMVRTAFVGAKSVGGLWRIELQEQVSGQHTSVRARVLVNTAGPWVNQVLETIRGARVRKKIRLVKGSHLIVPRIHKGSHAYLLQHPDRRVVFVIPFEEQYSLIGTTEVETSGAPDANRISHEEITYLIDAVAGYVERPPETGDIVGTYSGLRPLLDDGRSHLSSLSRDYALELEVVNATPLLVVYGGKITTYRRLAETAVEKLEPYFPELGPPWTTRVCLPGGDTPTSDRSVLARELTRECPSLPESLLLSLFRRHGTLYRQVLGGARTVAELGEHFGGELYAQEVDYMIQNEWARTSEDVLWRRTKFGLSLNAEQSKRVHEYIVRNQTPTEASNR